MRKFLIAAAMVIGLAVPAYASRIECRPMAMGWICEELPLMIIPDGPYVPPKNAPPPQPAPVPQPFVQHSGRGTSFTPTFIGHPESPLTERYLACLKLPKSEWRACKKELLK